MKKIFREFNSGPFGDRYIFNSDGLIGPGCVKNVTININCYVLYIFLVILLFLADLLYHTFFFNI